MDTVVKGNEHDSFETQLGSASRRLDGATQIPNVKCPTHQHLNLDFSWNARCLSSAAAAAVVVDDIVGVLTSTTGPHCLHYLVDFRRKQFGRVWRLCKNIYADIALELSLRGIRDVAAAGANE